MFTFSDITGNIRLLQGLKNSISAQKISHSYIFCGEKGSGKTLITKTFAKAISCHDNVGGEACNKCVSCKTFDSGNNPDIFFVDKTKNKSIGVDDVREQLVKEVSTKPFVNKYKIFLINDGDLLTVEAQNAILKTIEEPPSYGITIIECQNKNNLLQTILSRSVLYTTSLLSKSDIIAQLEKQGYNGEQAVAAANFCQGKLGQALELCNDELFFEIREFVSNMLPRLTKITAVYEVLKEMEKYKEVIDIVLDNAILFYRDALVYKQDDSRIVCTDKLNQIRSLSNMIPQNKLIMNIKEIEKTRAALERNANQNLAIEMLLINCTGGN